MTMFLTSKQTSFLIFLLFTGNMCIKLKYLSSNLTFVVSNKLFVSIAFCKSILKKNYIHSILIKYFQMILYLLLSLPYNHKMQL